MLGLERIESLNMNESLVIKGGRPLAGEIKVQGSKNASLAILAASILCSEPIILKNVPQIRDVEKMLKILRGLGAKIERQADRLKISTAGLNSYEPDPELVRGLRGSILLMGALLARFGKAIMPYPGGDAIGARPIDVHLFAFRELGATISETPDHFLKIEAPSGLKGAKIVLQESSVTGTENAMIAAMAAEGETKICLAATEPHVQDLAKFLNAIGGEIQGAGTHTILVKGLGRGLKNLRGTEHIVIPDSDEAVSLAVLAAATRSEVLIKGIEPEFLHAALQQLRGMAANIEAEDDWLYIKKPAGPYRSAKVQAGLYPKLMSDQVPPFAVLATQASGTSLIHEWMYEGRLGYVNELIKMGANAVIMDPHRALIVGPTPLRGAEVKGLDIRSGMTTIIAGLAAEGETVIRDASHIDRGFENIEERLRALGADIRRIRE